MIKNISLLMFICHSFFLKWIEALLIDENSFQGSIPACISNLHQLRQLYVFKNQLSGDIPQGLEDLSWLCKYTTPELSSTLVLSGKYLTFILQLDLVLRKIISRETFQWDFARSKAIMTTLICGLIVEEVCLISRVRAAQFAVPL